jgi:hypothetical protein
MLTKTPNLPLKISLQQLVKIDLPFQILRPSVIGGNMLTPENPYFISKYMVFICWPNFSILLRNEGDQENVRFIVNPDTVLNIIPVDYVAKLLFQFFNVKILNS